MEPDDESYHYQYGWIQGPRPIDPQSLIPPTTLDDPTEASKALFYNTSRGECSVLSRGRLMIQGGGLELPGGTSRPGETYAETCFRTVVEEHLALPPPMVTLLQNALRENPEGSEVFFNQELNLPSARVYKVRLWLIHCNEKFDALSINIPPPRSYKWRPVSSLLGTLDLAERTPYANVVWNSLHKSGLSPPQLLTSDQKAEVLLDWAPNLVYLAPCCIKHNQCLILSFRHEPWHGDGLALCGGRSSNSDNDGASLRDLCFALLQGSPRELREYIDSLARRQPDGSKLEAPPAHLGLPPHYTRSVKIWCSVTLGAIPAITPSTPADLARYSNGSFAWRPSNEIISDLKRQGRLSTAEALAQALQTSGIHAMLSSGYESTGTLPKEPYLPIPLSGPCEDSCLSLTEYNTIMPLYHSADSCFILCQLRPAESGSGFSLFSSHVATMHANAVQPCHFPPLPPQASHELNRLMSIYPGGMAQCIIESKNMSHAPPTEGVLHYLWSIPTDHPWIPTGTSDPQAATDSMKWYAAHEVLEDLMLDQEPLVNAILAILEDAGVDPALTRLPPNEYYNLRAAKDQTSKRIIPKGHIETDARIKPRAPIRVVLPAEVPSSHMPWLRLQSPLAFPRPPLPLPPATVPHPRVKALPSPRAPIIFVVPIKGFSALFFRDTQGAAHMGFHHQIHGAPTEPGSDRERITAIITLHHKSSIEASLDDLIPTEFNNPHGDRLYLIPCLDFTVDIVDASREDDDIEFLHVGSMEHISTWHCPTLPTTRRSPRQ